MLTKEIFISVDELWLKGKNRPVYYKKLCRHIVHVLKKNDHKNVQIKKETERLYLKTKRELNELDLKALSYIPGIALILPIFTFDRRETAQDDLRVMENESLRLMQSFVENLQNLNQKIKFRVNVKRLDKTFSIGSVEIEKKIGKILLDQFDQLDGELKKPEATLEIKIFPQYFSLSSLKIKGMGGLPLGSSGRGLVLLSGGFDSTVASYLMSRRGMNLDFVFFHAYPFVGMEVVDKIKNLSHYLNQFQMGARLVIVPFGGIQEFLAGHIRLEYRTLLFRKYMLVLAEALMPKLAATALITGDSLSQVSSQTIANLALLDRSVETLILRPLVGMNKRDILDWAVKIGSHDLSMIPHDDACALFAPEFPVTNPSKSYFKNYTQAWSEADRDQLQTLIQKAIDSAEFYSDSGTK